MARNSFCKTFRCLYNVIFINLFHFSCFSELEPVVPDIHRFDLSCCPSQIDVNIIGLLGVNELAGIELHVIEIIQLMVIVLVVVIILGFVKYQLMYQSFQIIITNKLKFQCCVMLNFQCCVILHFQCCVILYIQCCVNANPQLAVIVLKQTMTFLCNKTMTHHSNCKCKRNNLEMSQNKQTTIILSKMKASSCRPIPYPLSLIHI